MAKKARTISSATAVENDHVSQKVAVVTDEAKALPLTDETSAGAVGESVSTAIHNPENESNGMSEGSGNSAAPAPAEAIEGDTNTPESESGDAAGAGSSAPVKPQEGISPTNSIPDEAETAPSSPEVEAAASGTNSEPSQGAADDDGSMAGAVHALVIEVGARSVAQLRQFADLGSRLYRQFPELATGYMPPSLSCARIDNVGLVAFGLSADADPWVALTETKSRIDELRDKFRQRFTAIENIDVDAAPAAPVGSIRVKSTRDGFRRAGLVHSKVGQTFAPGALTEDQFKLLDGDPSITVEYI